jgi:hypothetical protein
MKYFPNSLVVMFQWPAKFQIHLLYCLRDTKKKNSKKCGGVGVMGFNQNFPMCRTEYINVHCEMVIVPIFITCCVWLGASELAMPCSDEDPWGNLEFGISVWWDFLSLVDVKKKSLLRRMGQPSLKQSADLHYNIFSTTF